MRGETPVETAAVYYSCFLSLLLIRHRKKKINKCNKEEKPRNWKYCYLFTNSDEGVGEM